MQEETICTVLKTPRVTLQEANKPPWYQSPGSYRGIDNFPG